MDLTEADEKCHAIAAKLARIPRRKRAKRLNQELSRFSPEEQNAARDIIGHLVAEIEQRGQIGLVNAFARMNHSQQIKWFGLVTGTLGLGAVAAAVFCVPYPSAVQYFVIRTVLALAAGAYAGGFTGFMRLKGKIGPFALAAGAGFAVTALVYYVNPPEAIYSHDQERPPSVQSAVHK